MAADTGVFDRDPRVSVVVPVYCNAGTLADLHRRLAQTLATLGEWEVIFVDDASPDSSRQVLLQLARSDPHVAVLATDCNGGQHRAVMLGLRYARAGWVVTMDADLQDPPEAIPSLLAALSLSGAAAVFAGRRGRYEAPGRLFTSRIFKTLLHWLTGLPADAGMFVAMDRAVVDRLLAMHVSDPFVVAMIGCAGLPTRSIPVERAPRALGASAYSTPMRLSTGGRALLLAVRLKRGAASGSPEVAAPMRRPLTYGARFHQEDPARD